MESHYREWELAEGHKLRRDEKSKKAATHHTNVMQWLHVADAVSPNGLPAQMVGDATEIINNALYESYGKAEMPGIHISNDMELTYKSRPYHILSESEQWRVDLFMTAAIANISGLGFMVIDRLDILDLRSRQSVMRWLSSQRDSMQSIIMATLKAPLPSNDWMSCHWLGDK